MDREQIDAIRLRRCMTGEGERQVIRAHSVAVIGNADQSAPAIARGDIDPRGSGIQRVFD